MDAATYYDNSKIKDTVRATMEGKVSKTSNWSPIPPFAEIYRTNCEAEREQVRRNKTQEWEFAKTEKDALLAQLTGFEKMAKDLERARSLRRFMDEIVASNGAPAKLVGSLELMTLMADWLDPLVKASWPEVDGIGERNPHGSL